MANKAKEKTSGELLVEEIQSLGRTHGVNTVFTNFLELTALALAIQLDPLNRTERQESYEKLEKSIDREALSAYGRVTFCLAPEHPGVPFRSKRHPGGGFIPG